MRRSLARLGLLVAALLPLATVQNAWAQGDQLTQLTLDKHMTRETRLRGNLHPGDVARYEYVITNNRDTTVTDVYVTDDHNPVHCPGSVLPGRRQMTCTGSYTITQADEDRESVTNTAVAHGRNGITEIASPASQEIVPTDDGPQAAPMIVHKIDATTGEPVPGAVFEFWTESNGIPGLQTTGDNPDYFVARCISNIMGECRVNSLVFRDYYMLEAVTPEGYEPPADPVTGPFVFNDAYYPDGLTITRTNTPIAEPSRGRITVVKRDQETGRPLAGGTFQLWMETNGVPGLQTDGADPDTLVNVCTTGSSGTCGFNDLELGTYYLKETATPDGFLAPADPVSGPYTLTEENAEAGLTAEISNSRTPGKPCKPEEKPYGDDTYGDSPYGNDRYGDNQHV
ncbi:collagen binding domain-containing protein [Streptomyces sp. NPDC048718]|uniref:MSCRAMM family protein n=1 Tax=Streptomyces sp. NPDC048718 TaxID=3365587 RepID=UPI00371FC4A5